MEHFEAWCAFMADEEATLYIGGRQDPSSVWRTMAGISGAWRLEGFGMYSLIDKETGKWIGRAGPWRPFGWPGTEIGWGIVRSRWGQGLAQEAAAVCIDVAIRTLGWTQIVHVISPDNTRSQALASRLGAENLGPCHLPGPLSVHPVELWGQSSEQWRSRSILV
jgi:RimJ/RimL family protein N-acetyltransferase